MELTLDQNKIEQHFLTGELKDGENFRLSVLHTGVKILVGNHEKSEMCKNVFEESGIKKALDDMDIMLLDTALKNFEVQFII